MLFIPPAPAPGTEPVAVTRNPFAFPYKPNTLDRDRIVLPTGWDSWGMIRILREGFDAKKWGEAWEHDMDPSADNEGNNTTGAADLYKNLVPDQGVKVCSFFPISLIFSRYYTFQKLTYNHLSILFFSSHHHYPRSTTLHWNRPSSPNTTRKTPKSPIAIHAQRSAPPHPICPPPQRASSVH
jgi:hypothetical protein